MRFSWISAALLCLLVAAGPAMAQKKKSDQVQPAAVTTPYSDVRRDNLLNGLQIITLERAEESTVRCDLIVRGGAMYDMVGKTGVVALTQRSLLAVNPALRDEMESLQAKIEWGVDWDTTWFRLEVPPNNFGAAMEILARLLVVDSISVDAFKRAQAEQIEKVRAGLSAPQAADEAFLKAVYGDHPYGHNILGSELTLSGLRQGDVYDIFQRFYLANNSSVIVSGKISTEQTLRVFKTLFGGWIKGVPAPATFRQPLPIVQRKMVRIEDPKAERTEVRGGVSGVKVGSNEYPVSRLLASILANRWRKEAAGIAATFVAERRYLAGPLWFSASLADGEATAVLRRLMEGFSAIGGASPVTAAELAAAKSELLAEYRGRTVVDWLRDIEVYQLPRNQPLTVEERIGAITVEETQALARKLLEANALSVVVLGRPGEALKATP